MNDKDEKLLLSARKLWKTLIHNHANDSTEILLERIDQYKKMLNIFQVGDYYYLIFNLVNGDVANVSAEVETVLGYTPAEMDSGLLLSIIHPDDKGIFLGIEDKITKFLNSITAAEFPFYKFQYDVRLKTKDNNYKRILVQYIMADYDEENIYHSFHLHTDITHIKRDGEPCFSIIGIDGRPSFYNIKGLNLQKSYDLFTRRERDIIKGIIEGKSTQKLADELFISFHTVNAHKRNIMEKAEVKSALELVSKSIKLGWI